MSISNMLAASLLALAATTASAQDLSERLQRGDAVVRHLNQGQTQPTLERMRQEFPFLADATQAYALGDVWSHVQNSGTGSPAGPRISSCR